MSYKCSKCGTIFDEPDMVHTTYESIYGGFTNTSTPCTIEVCPYCGSDEYDDYYDEEEEED